MIKKILFHFEIVENFPKFYPKLLKIFKNFWSFLNNLWMFLLKVWRNTKNFVKYFLAFRQFRKFLFGFTEKQFYTNFSHYKLVVAIFLSRKIFLWTHFCGQKNIFCPTIVYFVSFLPHFFAPKNFCPPFDVVFHFFPLFDSW